jgi:hypothetical protein
MRSALSRSALVSELRAKKVRPLPTQPQPYWLT